MEKTENNGGHYAKKLPLWKDRFVRNLEECIHLSLIVEHADMGDKEVEVFRRKLIYYFCYCEGGFATKTLGDAIITVGREGCLELMAGIPL